MCYQLLHEMLQYLADNEEYIGWSGESPIILESPPELICGTVAWAAGPIWGNNPACCNTFNGTNRLVGSLEPGIDPNGQPSQYYDVWKKGIQPYIPQDVKRSGVSGLC